MLRNILTIAVTSAAYVALVWFISWGSHPSTWHTSDRFATAVSGVVVIALALLYTNRNKLL